jgi:site-specific recombinase XerD
VLKKGVWCFLNGARFSFAPVFVYVRLKKPQIIYIIGAKYFIKLKGGLKMKDRTHILVAMINGLPENRKKTALKFNDYLLANDIKVNTRINYIYAIRSFFASLGKKDLRKVTRSDVEKWVRELKEKHKNTSANTMKVSLKKFYQWIYGMEEGYPDCVKWIKFRKEKSLPNNILTTKDILALVRAATNDRDRAFIHVLYESAGRISEVLDMKIKDVAVDEYGAAVNISGKSGPRRLRLISSVPDILRWLDTHPKRDNPETPLWYVDAIKRHDASKDYLSYDTALEKLKVTAKRAGVKKPINPHNLRHSRLTQLAKEGYMESELRIIAGWEKDSKMPSVYLHISGADIERKQLTKAGILEDENSIKTDEILKPIKCPRCKNKSPAGSKYCNCGAVIDQKEAYKIQDQNKALEDRISKLEAEREAVDSVMKVLKEKGII